MTSSTLTLSQCASEPIRVPGAIQPHGYLASVTVDSGEVVAFSANWRTLLIADGDAPVSEAIQRVLAPVCADRSLLAAGASSAALGVHDIGGQRLHVTAHRAGDVINLEFEQAGSDEGTQAAIYTLARDTVPRLQRADTVQALCEITAATMKALTGFGRCLVYRFDEEGHGRVLAESIDPGYESYGGHRFPASDIPPQARELYRVNHFRIIPDAHYTPVPVHFVAADRDAATFDMTHVNLRSVSPVHLEYMRNMGTLASMSVSIIVQDQLWGLISCHNHGPRHLSFETRVACEHLGHLLSMQVQSKEDKASVFEQLQLRDMTLAMVTHLADSDATLKGLVTDAAPLLKMGRASGAAVILDDTCWTAGDTPAGDRIVQLGEWLARRENVLYHTDRVSEAAPEFADLKDTASGVLSISISQVHRHFIVWFRPELLQNIEWAGDPRKAEPADANGRLHPRRSFATWRESVQGRSLPWRSTEVAAAVELRQALIGIVLRRAEEMAEVAMELGRVNKELEAFSYTVSHDLRAPMRHIAGYVDLVIGSDDVQLSPRALRYLSHVKAASSFAGQLVDALLDFSRMGRAALKRVPVNTQVLVEELVAEHVRQAGDRRIDWTVDGDLPMLWGDPILIQVAVRNLLSNAVKYTRTREVAAIHVARLSDDTGDGVAVSDNGVGFQMKYADKLFGVFQRLHRAEEFEGTGIGLASVRRIAERHGGAVCAQSAPDQGATFSFTVRRNAPDGAP